MSQILTRVGVNIKQVDFFVWPNSARSYWLNRVHMTINRKFSERAILQNLWPKRVNVQCHS